MYSWSSWSEWFWRFGRPGYGLVNVLLEWFLIGAVVYLCMRFLRGTRGSRVFIGVLVVLVAATFVVKLVAEQLNLERIKVLYPDFLVGMFLVALVVFQPELRRGLMRLGEARWLRSWTRDVDRLIDEVCRAAGYLSRNKIGALVALERDVPLDTVAAAGVRLDAEVSAELLITIFWPGSALHDLGVVIQSARIAAAGCQFPLVESEELDSSLGSRHRAALGLSQESDAVIVVVSEETGTISIAERGRLLRPLTAELLHRTLHEMLSGLKSQTAERRRRGRAEAADSQAMGLRPSA
jgi:diadenylate cyclase